MEIIAGVDVDPGDLVETGQHGVGEDVGVVAGVLLTAGQLQAAEGSWRNS